MDWSYVFRAWLCHQTRSPNCWVWQPPSAKNQPMYRVVVRLRWKYSSPVPCSVKRWPSSGYVWVLLEACDFKPPTICTHWSMISYKWCTLPPSCWVSSHKKALDWESTADRKEFFPTCRNIYCTPLNQKLPCPAGKSISTDAQGCKNLASGKLGAILRYGTPTLRRVH